MPNFKTYLSGKDLRSIAGVEDLLPLMKTQEDFDTVFAYLFSGDRLLVMRAADAVEKRTRTQTQYLAVHKSELLGLLDTAQDIELKWHLALLVPRLVLAPDDAALVWQKVATWVLSSKESRIVRVNALQALYELSIKHQDKREEFSTIIQKVKQEGVPSINARIKKFKME